MTELLNGDSASMSDNQLLIQKDWVQMENSFESPNLGSELVYGPCLTWHKYGSHLGFAILIELAVSLLFGGIGSPSLGILLDGIMQRGKMYFFQSSEDHICGTWGCQCVVAAPAGDCRT